MAKQHLISLRDASSRTGLAEEVIQKQIASGAIGGEKKSFFLWDEWFVQRSDLEKMKQLANKKQLENDFYSLEERENAENEKNTKNNSKISVPKHVAEEIERAFTPNTLPSNFKNSFAEATQASQATEEAVVQARAADNIFPQEIPTSPDSPRAVYPRGQMTAEPEFNSLTKTSYLGAERSEFPLSSEPSAPISNIAAMSISAPISNTSPVDTIDSSYPEADAIASPNSVLETDKATADEEAWTEYRSRAKSVAEEFLAPLIRRLELQASLLHEKDLLIAEQAAQLRLLPDFQRKTEDSVRLAKEKEKEATELRQKMTWERQKSLIKLSAWQMKHLQVQRKIRDTEDELALLQDQKETEVNELRCQLKDLQAQLSEQHKPWWKKIALSKEV
jgi:hypothetical protein